MGLHVSKTVSRTPFPAIAAQTLRTQYLDSGKEPDLGICSRALTAPDILG